MTLTILYQLKFQIVKMIQAYMKLLRVNECLQYAEQLYSKQGRNNCYLDRNGQSIPRCNTQPSARSNYKGFSLNPEMFQDCVKVMQGSTYGTLHLVTFCEWMIRMKLQDYQKIILGFTTEVLMPNLAAVFEGDFALKVEHLVEGILNASFMP